MKITKIEIQKNNQSRVNLYIDEIFYKGLPQELIFDLKLEEGKEITAKEASEIEEAVEYSRAMAKAFGYLTRRMQSEKELRTKLWQKKYKKGTIEKVISRLRELEYINDSRFAKSWVESRGITRGQRLLKVELIKKGISKQIIEELFFSEANKEDDEANVLILIKKKYGDKINSLSKEERYNKVGGYLARRGYDYSTISRVLRDIEDL